MCIRIIRSQCVCSGLPPQQALDGRFSEIRYAGGKRAFVVYKTHSRKSDIVGTVTELLNIGNKSKKFSVILKQFQKRGINK